MAIIMTIAGIWLTALGTYMVLIRREPGHRDLTILKRTALPSVRDRFAVDVRMLRTVRIPHPNA